MSKPEPLHIRAYLQCGIIADAGMPLDAVLLYHAMRRQNGPQSVTICGDTNPETTEPVRLPFHKHNDRQPDWFYAVSFGQWNQPTSGTDYWNKRLDQSLTYLIDFEGRKGSVTLASGKYKPYHMPIFYRHALWIDWYCLGYRRPIESLLRFCAHLGKKTSQGWGAVLRWEINNWHADWSVIDDNGHLMRPIPSPVGERIIGIRPPYRLEKNQFCCAIPESLKAGVIIDG